MDEDRIWNLATKKLADAAIREEEEKELADLLKDHPEWHFTMEILYWWWNAVPGEQADEKGTKKLLERVKGSSNRSV